MSDPLSAAHRFCTQVHTGSESDCEPLCVAAPAAAQKCTHVGSPSLEGNRCAQCTAASGSQMHVGRTDVQTGVQGGPEIDRLLAAGHRAVAPHLADDDAEVGLHGRLLP